MNQHEDIAPYFAALRGESDRGVIVLSAAFIDDLLKELLTAFFVETSKKMLGEMLEGTGPVSTFSARSKMALCLGFITEDELSDLDRIRWIRNKAAHLATSVNFADTKSEIVRKCESFCTLTDRTNKSFSDTRERYLLAAGWLAVKISSARERVERRKPPEVPADMDALQLRAILLAVHADNFAKLRADGSKK